MKKIGRCLLMKKNNAGFTMIELLAAVVVLGILMIIAVPTVTNVLHDSKNKTYIDDSIRLISTFENQMRKDNMMPVPAKGCCIAMNLTYLDNNTFNDAPYEGEYDRVFSFVIADRLENGEKLSRGISQDYAYYVRLMEKLPGDNAGYRGVDLEILDKGSDTTVVDLYDRSARDVLVKNKGSIDMEELDLSLLYEWSDTPAPGSWVFNEEKAKDYASHLKNNYGIKCYDSSNNACIVVYAPNREDESGS